MSRYLTLMTTPWLFSRVTLANFGHGRIYVLHAVKIKIAVIVYVKICGKTVLLNRYHHALYSCGPSYNSVNVRSAKLGVKIALKNVCIFAHEGEQLPKHGFGRLLILAVCLKRKHL